ncbi:DUF2730 family protein [Acinetobacter junii]|uniref:DUF2730 family protein n=1 Tax=Acinetobacter junii TaxID=40215 RepID=UPI00100EF411|nr:DUF2730 domain-containing protein [Acinetobacter junii]RXS99017.1 DUF2730 domain-containing protein [Acinetobacter junii]
MFEALKLSFSEAHWVVMTILGLYTWFINKQSASAQEMLDLRLRVVEVENAIKDMPSKLEIAKLEGQMETLKQQLNSANSSITQVQLGVTRIENYLLDNKK